MQYIYFVQYKFICVMCIVYDNMTSACMFPTDDIHRLKQGLETQYYDAFLLYAEEDNDFAIEMVEKLETQFKLKVLRINEIYV